MIFLYFPQSFFQLFYFLPVLISLSGGPYAANRALHLEGSRLPSGFFPGHPVILLKFPGQLTVPSGNLGQLVFCLFAPHSGIFSPLLFPSPFYSIPVHRIGSVCFKYMLILLNLGLKQ